MLVKVSILRGRWGRLRLSDLSWCMRLFGKIACCDRLSETRSGREYTFTPPAKTENLELAEVFGFAGYTYSTYATT